MKRLMKKYLKRTQKPLESYKIFKKKVPINKWAFLLLGIFLVMLVYSFLELFDAVGTEYLPLPYMAIVGGVFGLGPLLHIHWKTTHRVVICEDAFARQNIFRFYKLIMYRDVRKVRHTRRNALKIRTKRKTLHIPLSKYPSEMEVLKRIFNYEGHFKQPRKPYKVFFDYDEVDVQILKPSFSKQTSHLIESFSESYFNLTPGYLDDISLYGATVEKVRFVDKKHAVFELSHIDLKKDHPDNTDFTAKQTDEAVMIFENVMHVEIFNLGKSKPADVELLGTGFDDLKKVARKTDVFSANFKPLEERMSLDLTLASGASKKRVRFTFKDAIVGFNKLEKDAWFERQS